MKQPTKNFTQVPNETWQLYCRRLPNFKAEHGFLYTILRDYFNAGEGYAYPTHYTLALDMGSSIDRVKGMLKVLEDSGLITTIKRTNNHGNDKYVVHDPITTEEEFYKQFPEAKMYYEERLAKMDTRKVKDKERRSNMYADEQPVQGLAEVKRTLTVNDDSNKEDIDTSWF